MDVNGLITIAGGTLTIVATVGVGARYVVRSMGRIVDQWQDIRNDIYGEPARLGRPAVPGALDRLGKAEAALVDLGLRAGVLERRMDDHVGRGHSDHSLTMFPGGMP